ncbi:hypothetical protein F5Y13DRAFT_187108 [Hypoxylon sp. FL1857]|nr:hypothetical protein F5Y13DRAFT_187108 [Hypoxylon sp. FL1857]
MKFTTTISLITFASRLAAAAPAPELTINAREGGDCIPGDDWKLCIMFGFYRECINGAIADYSCDGSCKIVCPIPDNPCAGVCFNRVPCAEIGCGSRGPEGI